VSLVFVDLTPHELRLRAEHCRQLADSQFDERARMILKAMAGEFDQQARDLVRAEASMPSCADSAY
jgi:hypothetical protein